MRTTCAKICSLLLLFIALKSSAQQVQEAPTLDNGCVIDRPSRYHAFVGEEGSLRIPRPVPIENAPQLQPMGQGQRENSSRNEAWATESAPDYPQVLTAFSRWQQHFAKPVVCNMIFCHSSCADYDDSCPSFQPPIIHLQEQLKQQLKEPGVGGCGNSDMFMQPRKRLESLTQPQKEQLESNRQSTGNKFSKNCCHEMPKSETFHSQVSLTN
jgi:hypothetical protein